MPDIFKFPNNGYDVTVVRKQDIINCLDANVVDKDVVLAVISQCELDASNFLNSGRWTGIPFLGSIKVPRRKELYGTPEVKELIETARETLEPDKYMVFRQHLGYDLKQKEKQERFYRYIVSNFVGKNREFYNKLSKRVGEKSAQFICYTLTNLSIGAPREDF